MPKIEFTLCIDDVETGMVTSKPVSVTNDEGLTVISIRPNTPLTAKTIERLRRNGVKELEVFLEPVEASLYTPATQSVKPLIGDDLRDEAVENIRNLFTNFSEGGNKTTAYTAIQEIDRILDQILVTISEESNAFVHITGIQSYDEYTYHHSLSVAVLALAIGQEKGLNAAQLKKLGQSAILHDIGKTYVPIELINKKGPLSPEEFEVVKKHAQKSREYLEHAGIGDPELWAAVTHHHEKIDGTGYPNNLKGDEIPYYSRIITVADVYDAITSYRPYRNPMPPAQAIELIMSEADRSFDPSIVKAFIDKLEPYPLNTVVELSDNRQGMVIGDTRSMRPRLRMLDNGQILSLVDMECLHLVITKILDMSNSSAPATILLS